MFSHEIDDELKELTFDFFYKFSRFEYYLRTNGFGKSERKEQIAYADWPLFRKTYESNYRLSVEARELLANPPKMQIINNGKIQFFIENYDESDSNLRKIIRSIQRIRNNLFHGGKCGAGTEGEIKRNKYLLNKGSIALDQIAKLDSNVEFDYPGSY